MSELLKSKYINAYWLFALDVSAEMKCHPSNAKTEIDDIWDNDMNHVKREIYRAKATEWKSQVKKGIVLEKKGPNLLRHLREVAEKVKRLRLEREEEEMDRHKHAADEVKNMKMIAAIQKDEADCNSEEEFDEDAAMMYEDDEETFEEAYISRNSQDFSEIDAYNDVFDNDCPY